MNEQSLFREMGLLRAAYDQLARAEARVEEQFDATVAALHEAGFSMSQITKMTGGSSAAVSRSINRLRDHRSG
ncbi:hypothetical protein ITJ57_03000 [Plantibacter sp. VKM Ac-2880]|uniref:hypothetical protein n=1 Tax=Plantibacter sp. VKM Ac-2880 TaxID=2783827 RepID=UPI00188F10DA|nr:hypothetical protein [Plantibacter sp. VKM Ac-2880]MBF4567725.1 hypothetical protein [Plantibacter sp. VKM Ac-2880]